MPTALELKSLLFVFYLITFGMPTAAGASPAGVKAASAGQQTAKGDPDSQEDSADEDLAPAALQFDVSNVSPLIRERLPGDARNQGTTDS